MKRGAIRPWMFVSAAWLAPAILGGVNELAQHRFRGEPGLSIPALLFGAGDWLIYAALTPFVFALSAHVPLLRPHLPRKLLLHLSVALSFCVAWAAAGTGLKAALMPEGLWGDVRTHFLIWLFITFPFGVAVYLGLVGAEHGIRYFTEARERQLEMARLAEQLSTARLTALQAKVNPHFLFNTLNTITVLVRDGDRDAATRILELFSELLRRTLARREHEVRLDDEIELVRDYLEIERARFSDRLRPRIEVDASLSAAAVPSFSIQHLVENAVRHAIARDPLAGEILVSVRREGAQLEVVVRDDGPGLAGEIDRPGHGLEASRERLAALYGELASLTVESTPPRGATATLRLPYREVVEEPDE